MEIKGAGCCEKEERNNKRRNAEAKEEPETVEAEQVNNYICLDCGLVFSEDQIKRWTEPHGEKMSGCPNCGGAYAEARRCRKCGELFADGSLFDGMCDACLTDSVTYDTGLKYLLDIEDYFDIFIFEVWYESLVPKFVSTKLRDMMVFQYKRECAEESLLGKHDLLDALKKFILEDEGNYGKEVYAKWLREQK